MTNLEALNQLATSIVGSTVTAKDNLSAINAIATKGKGSAVAEKDIATALDAVNTYISGIVTPASDIEANKAVSITENDTVEITPSSGKDGMAKVTVTVNVPTSAVTPPDWYTDGADSVVPESTTVSMANLTEEMGYQTNAFTGDGTMTINDWCDENNVTPTAFTWLWNDNGVMILGYEYNVTEEP